MTSTTQDGPDTALARVLHAQGALPLPTLQNLLERVRAQRLHDPHASLEALLRANHTLPPHTLQRALDSLAPPPPTLGPYVLQRELARGGMGAVHLALDPHTGAHLALKTLPRELAQDPDLLLRFQAEAQLAAQLDHPHIARVHAADFSADPPYLVQELLTGGSLQDRLQHGPLPVDEAVRVVSQLCDAVAHAHQHGVIHRDLKPDNVLFDEHGHAKLVDFGLARQLADAQRLTHTGQLLGTPNYMAPEQAHGAKNTDERTDVYGLGGILYACLTGRPPFTGPTVFAVLEQVLGEPPQLPSKVRPEVPEELDRAVRTALAKSPEQRPPTVRGWVQQLHAAPPPRRSLRWVWAVGGLVCVVVGLSLGRGGEEAGETVEAVEVERVDPTREVLDQAQAALLDGDAETTLALLEGWDGPRIARLRGCALLWEGDLNDAEALLTQYPLAVEVERKRRAVTASQRERMQNVSMMREWGTPEQLRDRLEECEVLIREGRAQRACVGEALWPQFRERLHTPGLLELAALRDQFFKPSLQGVHPLELDTYLALIEAYEPQAEEPLAPTSAMALGIHRIRDLHGSQDPASLASWLEQWPQPAAFRHPALRNLAHLGGVVFLSDAPADAWGSVDVRPEGRSLPLELAWLETYLKRHARLAFARFSQTPADHTAFAAATRWRDALVRVVERRSWQRTGNRVLHERFDRLCMWAHAPTSDPLASLLPPHLARRVDLRALYLESNRTPTNPQYLTDAIAIVDFWLDLTHLGPVAPPNQLDDALTRLETAYGRHWPEQTLPKRWREAGLRLRFGWAARTGRWWIALRDAARLGRFDSPLRWQRGDPWHELRQPGPSRWTTW